MTEAELTLFLPGDDAAQLLVGRARLERDLEDLDAELTATAWHEWGRRRWLRSLRRDKREDLRNNADALRACDWDAFAGRLIDRQLIVLHEKSSSRRHRYHPEVLGRVGTIAVGASRQLHLARIRVEHGHPVELDVDVRVTSVDELAPRLTASAVEQHIAWCVERLQEVASDPVFLHEWVAVDDPAKQSCPVLLVQHKASGLRARFHPEGDQIGSVYSKPYKIWSIDADFPGVLSDWHGYVGLGIGTRLYQVGADLVPEQRWAQGGSTTASARAVRRRLHAHDPYRWEASC